jgi:hypothetical protein
VNIMLRICLPVLFFNTFLCPLFGQTKSQTNDKSGSSASIQAQPGTVDDAIDRVIAREHDEMTAIRLHKPIVETYIQELKLDKDSGTIPTHDTYFLGQADMRKGVVTRSLLVRHNGDRIKDAVRDGFDSSGFLQMAFIDATGFDRQHYKFEYSGREFLGEVRCLVFDVTPLPKSGKQRFTGRLWVEDRQFTVVRFNGIFGRVDRKYVGDSTYSHFDSWRANVQPGLWVPAYIYTQELNLKYSPLGGHVRFKAQTRLWGYNPAIEHRQAEFSSIKIDPSSDIQEQADAQRQDRSPLDATREWRRQAEANVIDGLERTGLLAPPGEVDKVLDTVVNNIELTNNLDEEFHCRVATVGTFEMFTIGRMIVLSRGLVDVLPDEATLAAMLSVAISDALVPKPLADQYGFSDFAHVPAEKAMQRYSFKGNKEDVESANEKALELLRNSPYKDKLGNAGLFLKQLNVESKSLTALINPRLGNSVFLASQLQGSAPDLEPQKLDQIAALPIGARIKLDPWNDRVELLKTKTAPLTSSREKMPFEVTPFMPFLTRFQEPVEAGSPNNAGLTGKQQPAGNPNP